MRRAALFLVFVVGCAVIAFPHVSVWRLKHQVLDLVPVPAGAAVVVEETVDGPLTEDDFLLAYRLVGATVKDVIATLHTEGFENGGRPFGPSTTLIKPCCGSYDGVIVSVFEGRDGLAGLRISVQDDDITTSWYLISGVGLLFAVASVLALFMTGRADSTVSPMPGQTASAET